MKKEKFEWKNNTFYLLGTDSENTKYYLQKPTWDCGWYWSFGYVETFTNNKNPKNSKDIVSHEHITEPYQWFFGDCDIKPKLIETPFTDKEKWTIYELIKTCYTIKEYAEVISRGGSHIAKNPEKDFIINEKLADEINQKDLPRLFKALEKILED